MDNRRYYELDWLRVILILAVFLHHVFMPFNGDGWHIMNADSSKLLDDIMVYFEQLRLPSMFFIAGAGSFLLLKKTKTHSFLMSKFHRLVVPFIVGMILVIPPQKYYEEPDKYLNLVDAYQKLWLSFSPHHLWFIEFLIVFMLFAPLLNYLLKTKAGNTLSDQLANLSRNKHGLFALVLLLICIRLPLKYVLPSQSHSVDNLSVSLFYLSLFILGMIFIARKSLWQALALHRKTNLAWFITSSILFYAYYFKPDISDYVSLPMRWQLYWLMCTLVTWSGLLTMMGYASQYANHRPRWLKTANESIYPFYIFHQTVIVALAYYIIQWPEGIAVKSITLLICAFFISALLCVLIKPLTITRYIFGLNMKSDTQIEAKKTANLPEHS